MRSAGSWEELLDRLEEELEGATPSEPFLPPESLGPPPAELAARLHRVQGRLAEAEAEVLQALVVLRQELALLPASQPEHPRFLDTLA